VRARPGRPRFTPTSIPTSDGLQLAAETIEASGREARGAVIFVHGFCGNKGENGLFHALAARSSDMGYTSVLYDWRGLADSQGDFPSTSIDDHTADFMQVAEWTRSHLLDLRAPLHAVGFSLGAAVVGLALRRDLALTSVAYLSPAVRPRLSMWPRYNHRRIQRELGIRGVVEKPGSSVLLGRPILESLRQTDLGPDAFDIGPPLVVCHGTKDARIHCAHTRKLAAHRTEAQDFRYVEFEGASHSFRPETSCWPRLASTVTDWFAEATRPPATNRVDSSERQYRFA
jgi:alpha-beta hydrolase superfamily lysophospholipase